MREEGKANREEGEISGNTIFPLTSSLLAFALIKTN
jgi:hypothetical protein